MFEKLKKRRKTDIVDIDIPTVHEYETTFSRDYLIGQIEISKFSTKNIIKYIQDECKQFLDTEDYYYGYIYENSILKYVVHKSNKHEVGKASILSAVLINEGKYHLVADSNFYVFENNGAEILDKIDYKDIDSEDHTSDNLGINLETIKLGNIPDTLVLKWSLEKKSINILAILTVIFAISLITVLNTSNTYKKVSLKAEEVKRQYLSIQIAKKAVPILDISEFTKKLAVIIEGRAIITKIVADENKINASLQFKNEYDAQNFIKANGGNYENGKVVCSAIFTNNK